LTNNDLGPDAIQSLLPLMPTLVSLNLNSCKIGNKGVFELSNSLSKGEKGKNQQKNSLEVLDLSNNGITLAGFIQLINRFRTSPNLHTLNVSQNRFDNE
jgi:Ran GTPase-activating protein (RanGAP) involved in mRNA processing and transport